jgi:hypothetical protein
MLWTTAWFQAQFPSSPDNMPEAAPPPMPTCSVVS